MWGKSTEQHAQRLTSVFQISDEAELTFNPDKFKIGVDEIEFVLNVISQDGIKSNSALIKSIEEIPTPSHKEGVQLQLGVVNYFSKYLPF